MQLTTPNGLYFFGTMKELIHFLENLSNRYTMVTELLSQKH